MAASGRHPQGISHLGSLSPELAGARVAGGRIRGLGRRKDQYPGTFACQPTLPTQPGVAYEGRTRIQALRRLGLSGSARCSSWQALWGAAKRRPALFLLVDSWPRSWNNLPTSGRRVFWILDNGSSHRGERCVATAGQVSASGGGPWPRPRQLAESNQNLLSSAGWQRMGKAQILRKPL